MPVLPARTEALFIELRGSAAIAAYTLVGGTALALRLQHRVSADLDFAVEGRRLDRGAIRAVLRALDRPGRSIRQYPHDLERHSWDNAGLELDDHQQDFDVAGVKLSFFVVEFPRTLPQPLLAGHSAPVPGLDSGHIQVLDLKALALMKSLLLGQRITTRDLFDIVALVRHGVMSFPQLFAWQDSHSLGYDYLRSRLLHAAPAPNDPGVQPLAPGIPSGFSALLELLLSAMDEYERTLAARAFKAAE